MSTTKSEELPAVYSGLSPRGAPGVYRHALRTRLWPKPWSQDTQSATSGTLFIQSPRDKSSDFRQELWSYQDENRGPAKSGVHQLPHIPYRFRSSLEFDGYESEKADGSQYTEGKNLPRIHHSTKNRPQLHGRSSKLESSANINQVITSVERENALNLSKAHTPDVPLQPSRNQRSGEAEAVINVEDRNSTAPKTYPFSRPINVQRMTSTSFRDNHSLYVPRMINVTSTRFGPLKRFRSEEQLTADVRKRLQWEAQRHLGKIPDQQQGSHKRALISIVGKLPTVRKGMLKTLQTMQKEKYCGEVHADVNKSIGLTPAENKVIIAGDLGIHPGLEAAHPGNAMAKESGNTADEATFELNRHLHGHDVKLNPSKMHTSGKGPDGSPTDARKLEAEQSENICDQQKSVSNENNERKPLELRQLPKELTGNLKQDLRWVQNAIDTGGIIYSAGYNTFARKQSPDTFEQRILEEGNNIDSTEDRETEGNPIATHPCNTEFGNSKCYPKFSSEVFIPSKNGAIKSPRKLTKLKKI